MFERIRPKKCHLPRSSSSGVTTELELRLSLDRGLFSDRRSAHIVTKIAVALPWTESAPYCPLTRKILATSLFLVTYFQYYSLALFLLQCLYRLGVSSSCYLSGTTSDSSVKYNVVWLEHYGYLTKPNKTYHK